MSYARGQPHGAPDEECVLALGDNTDTDARRHRADADACPHGGKTEGGGAVVFRGPSSKRPALEKSTWCSGALKQWCHSGASSFLSTNRWRKGHQRDGAHSFLHRCALLVDAPLHALADREAAAARDPQHLVASAGLDAKRSRAGLRRIMALWWPMGPRLMLSTVRSVDGEAQVRWTPHMRGSSARFAVTGRRCSHRRGDPAAARRLLADDVGH